MASLLALYDEEYSEYSLGMYTMLKEVELANIPGESGTIRDTSRFAFRIRLQIETGNGVLHTEQAVGQIRQFHKEQSVAHRLHTAMHQLASALLEEEHSGKTWYYPYFSMGYMLLWKDRFLHLPWILESDTTSMACAPLVTVQSATATSSHINPCPDEQHFINMEQAGNSGDHQTYLAHLMEYGMPIAEGNLTEMLRHIQFWFNRTDRIPPV